MKKHRSVYYVLTVLYIFSFLACAGTPQNQQPSTVSQSKVVPGVQKVLLSSVENMPLNEPLPGRYDNIIIRKFTSDTQTKENYPRATYDCQASIIWQLKEKNAYANVTDVNTKYPGKSVYVDMEIVDIRITSTTARIWGGAFAGSSFMDVLVEISDSENKKIVHKKVLSTSNNAMAAAWSSGSSDKSLPSDLGILIGEYIYRIVHGTK